jgi:lysozyme
VQRGGQIAWAAGITSALVAFVAQWEGKVSTTRIDPISGVYDVCHGHTGKYAIPGKSYSDDECMKILREDIATHRAGVLECLQAPVNQNQLDSFTSLAFNIGTGAACRSTAMRLFNEGQTAEACEAFMLFRGVWRDGQFIVVKGLLRRREAERLWCLTPSDGPRGASLFQFLQESP